MWPDRDEAFLDVAQSIRRAIEEIGKACEPKRTHDFVGNGREPRTATADSLPRSPNLCLRKEFSKADKDEFVLEAFEYPRVSSSSQNLDLQLEQLADAGCEKVFSEKVTGTSRNDRQALAECLDWLSEGDTLVVTRLDRLARSGRDIHAIIAQLSAKRGRFRCVQQGAVDTNASMGKLILGILSAVAEFETDIRKERQREGIERTKAAGVYKGRKHRR